MPRLAHPLWLATAVLVVGCVPNLCPEVNGLPGGPGSEEGASWLAIGDSLLATHGAQCQNVPAHAALERGAFGDDRSVSGRRLTHPGHDRDIMGQFEPGPWEWVLVTGGANDMLQECGCNRRNHDVAECEQVLDDLADPDGGSGDIYDLLDLIVEGGADDTRILVLGYYHLPEDSLANFDQCNGYVQEANARWRLATEEVDGAWFLETDAPMDFEAHPAYFASDHIHPSPEGAAVLGRAIAERMAELEAVR